MSQRIISEQEEKTGHAQALARCYGNSVMANSKLVESAVSSMEEPDMAAFVQVFKTTCFLAPVSSVLNVLDKNIMTLFGQIRFGSRNNYNTVT